MDYNLKCELCGEQLQVNSTCPLGKHLLDNHPEVDLTFFSSYEDLKKVRNVRKDVGNESSKNSSSVVFICRSKRKIPIKKISSNNCCGKNIEKRDIKKNTVISATVETWKSSDLRIRCPKCKLIDLPEVRKRTTKIFDNPLAIILMLTCWPLCFFPFMTSKNNNLDLFCRNCGFYLGDYDKLLLRPFGNCSC